RGLETKVGPAGKWAAYGAVAGVPVPVLGPLTGAFLGGVAAKVWEWRQQAPAVALRELALLHVDKVITDTEFDTLRAAQLERLVTETRPHPADSLRTLNQLVADGVVRSEVAEPYRLRLIEKLSGKL
ncbi:MAG: hypothetical protein ACKVPX_07040, partial [Myxococcaceae bacterium]